MPNKNENLHGMVPDKSDVVLLLIDVINDLEWEGGEQLLPFALPMAQRISELKQRAHDANIPVIYVNDNFGQWKSERRALIRHCLEDEVRGQEIVKILVPDDDDYFVLKPKHSGFFSTNLDILLEYLGAKTLILTGTAGDVCVLFTANDAYMRDFTIVAPRDCIASNTKAGNDNALELIERVLKGDTRASHEINFDEWKQSSDEDDNSESKPEVQTPQFASQN